VTEIAIKRTMETYHHSAIHYDDSDQSSRARLARSMGNRPARKVLKYKVDRILPELLVSEFSNDEWSGFCDRLDIALEPIGLLKSKNCALIFLKSSFILLGFVGSMIYWSGAISLRFGEDIPPVTLYVLAAWVPMGYLCIKGCFRRNVAAELEIIEGLEHMLLAENMERSNVMFSLRMEDEIVKALKIWCCRGGFSFAHSVEFISCIECRLIYYSPQTMMEEGKLPIAESPSVVVVNEGANTTQKISSHSTKGGGCTAAVSIATATAKEAGAETAAEDHGNEDTETCASAGIDASTMACAQTDDENKVGDLAVDPSAMKDFDVDGGSKQEVICDGKDDNSVADKAAPPKEEKNETIKATVSCDSNSERKAPSDGERICDEGRVDES